MACCKLASSPTSRSFGTRGGQSSRGLITGLPTSPVGTFERRMLPGTERRGRTTIWSYPSPKFIMGGSDEDKFDHPTQKPVELMRKPILNHTKSGELVYDPFLGSGTTLAAAEVTGRVCYGLELDPKYADVVVERWQSVRGWEATLGGDGRTFDVLRQDDVRLAA